MWEVEIGVGTRALRGEDQAWAQQMYEEGHKGGRKWAQHHAHQAEHILLWDGQGVGAATGAKKRVRAATCTEVDAAAPRTRRARAERVDVRDGRALCEEGSGGRVAPDDATGATSAGGVPEVERGQASTAGKAPARDVATHRGRWYSATDGMGAARAAAECGVEPCERRTEECTKNWTAPSVMGGGRAATAEAASTTRDADVDASTRSQTRRDDRKRGRGEESASGGGGGDRGDAGSAEDGTARRRRRSRRSRIGDETELAGGQEYANVQGTRVNYLDGNTSNDGCADNDDSGVAEITEAEYGRGVKRKRQGGTD